MGSRFDLLAVFMAAQLANPVLADRPMADLAQRADDAVKALKDLPDDEDDEDPEDPDIGSGDPPEVPAKNTAPASAQVHPAAPTAGIPTQPQPGTGKPAT